MGEGSGLNIPLKYFTCINLHLHRRVCNEISRGAEGEEIFLVQLHECTVNIPGHRWSRHRREARQAGNHRSRTRYTFQITICTGSRRHFISSSFPRPGMTFARVTMKWQQFWSNKSSHRAPFVPVKKIAFPRTGSA